MTTKNKMAKCQKELAVAQSKIDACWEDMVREALKSGPKRIGDLIEALEVFDLGATAADVATRFTDGLSPFGGSFVDSPAQKALGRMVEEGSVIWQRAANMDNWYALPGQEFPAEAAVRKRTLRQMAKEVLELLPAKFVFGYKHDKKVFVENETIWNGIEDDDVLVEIDPFVLSIEENGWELADGDPTCNWCGNTFTKEYPMDVDAKVIVAEIKRRWNGLYNVKSK